MILALTLPSIIAQMTEAQVRTAHLAVGAMVKPGSKMFDLTVDLSAIASQDCPPISHYRIVLREAAWLRRLHVSAGDVCPVATTLAVFSTEPDEEMGLPVRAIRSMVAGIVLSAEDGLW